MLGYQTSISFLDMQTQLTASQLADVFYCTRASWPIAAQRPKMKYTQVNALVFYRRSFRKRLAGFGVYINQWYPSETLRVSLERSLDDVLAHLLAHGYTLDIRWLVEPRETMYHHLISAHDALLWTSNQLGTELREG